MSKRECDSCGEDIPQGQRRRRCWHCGQWVCGYCWHHEHACEPGHSKKECSDLATLQRLTASHGRGVAREYLERLRILSIAKEERDAEEARRRLGGCV